MVVCLDDFLLVADSEEACQQGFEMLIELVEYVGVEAKLFETNNGQAVVLNKRPVVRDFFAVDAPGEEAVDGE